MCICLEKWSTPKSTTHMHFSVDFKHVAPNSNFNSNSNYNSNYNSNSISNYKQFKFENFEQFEPYDPYSYIILSQHLETLNI